MLSHKRVIAATVAAVLFAPVASATNGYFSHGWGTKSKAMAGVATALPQDALVAATNPAGMAFVGERMDFGVSFFNPSDRGYKANDDYARLPDGTPTGPFVTPGKYDSDKDWFLVPSFGYNRALTENSTIGVSVFGNGGMNTHYTDRAVWENFALPENMLVGPDGNPLIPFQFDPTCEAPNNANPCGVFTATTATGVNLEQLFIELPYTIKMGNGRQAFGIAPAFAVQRFKAKGLQPFKAASLYPNKVTNNGDDWSYGVGVHFGWQGDVNDRLAVGLSYRTKMWMTRLDDYKGLFADKGHFDIPAMFNAGLAYKVQPNLTVAFDYQHIFYDEIDALSNSNDNDLSPCFAPGPKPEFCLGGKDGLGFGWDSMDIAKLGLKYDYNEKLSFMGGVSYNSEFSSGRQALFNILAPATIRWHLTLGASYRYSPRSEFNFAFSYMPKETLDGTSPSITQTQTGSIYMQQMDIEIGYSHHF